MLHIYANAQDALDGRYCGSSRTDDADYDDDDDDDDIMIMTM